MTLLILPTAPARARLIPPDSRNWLWLRIRFALSENRFLVVHQQPLVERILHQLLLARRQAARQLLDAAKQRFHPTARDFGRNRQSIADQRVVAKIFVFKKFD